MSVEILDLYTSGLYQDEEFKSKFLEFCRQSWEFKEDPAHVNMWNEHWEADNTTLPYHIFISKRLCSVIGETFVQVVDDQIVSVSSVYISDFDPYVSVGGVRSWVIPEFRGQFQIGRHLLPRQLAWAKSKQSKIVMLTFNDYNKRLIPYFERTGFGIKKNRNPNSLFFNGLHKVDFPIEVQHTKQWAIYHKIDEEYTVDWEKIRWIDHG